MDNLATVWCHGHYYNIQYLSLFLDLDLLEV